MRQLTTDEFSMVSAGMHDVFSILNSTVQYLTNCIKPELLFSAVALALFMSPGGWQMTLAGGLIGAAVGVSYNAIKDGL